MDVDRRLNALLKKYDLCTECIDNTYIEYLFIKKISNVQKLSKIAIWGAGEHTHELLKIINLEKVTIDCIIDKNLNLQGKLFDNYAVYSPKDIEDRKIDIIIISSLSFRKEIINEVQNKHSKCSYIDIYDIYDIVNENLNTFYHYKNQIYYYRHSFNLFLIRKLYENSNSNEEKEKYLLELIAQYLYQRDFIHARTFIEVYIENKYSNYSMLMIFTNELNNLLDGIKNIVSHQKDNVIMTVIDAMRAKDIFDDKFCSENMPFLHKTSKKSVVFNNAFSNSTYTRLSFNSFLRGKLPLSDNTYNTKYNLKWNESKLLSDLYEHGSSIYNFSMMIMEPECERVTNLTQGRNKIEASTIYFWRYICKLAYESNLPNFTLMHVFETHPYHVCGYHDKNFILKNPVEYYMDYKKYGEQVIFQLRNQYKESLKYIDAQLKFYMSFLSSDSTQIIISDHGQLIGDKKGFGTFFTWYDEVINVPLIIYNKEIKPKVESRLFSMSNLGEEILYIIKNKVVKEYDNEVVIIERDPIYNKSFKENSEFKNLLGPKFLNSFKVVRSNFDKYILYSNGIEEYYLISDETNNLIYNKKYKNRIEILKSKINCDFPKFVEDKYK